MAGGPLLYSSMDLTAASGNLSSTIYVPATNTNTAGSSEGIGVVASLAADAPVNLEYNMPVSIPAGTMKLRCLARANAVSGVAKVTVKDINVAAGANPGAPTLNTETQISQTWATADVLVENKVTLTSAPAANDVLVVQVIFNTSGWTLAAVSVWQFSIIWE